MFFRLAPIAMRKATSPRRCWVRNQKVPITPRKIFNNRKKRIQNWVRNSLSLSISLAVRTLLYGVTSSINIPYLIDTVGIIHKTFHKAIVYTFADTQT